MFGFQTWGHRTLGALLAAGHEVALVVTHPPSDHAYERIWGDSVEELARAHGVPVLRRAGGAGPWHDEELLLRLKDAEPEVIVATNWRTWIPPEIYELPRLGTLNVHDSLLPAYAGFAPINWAIANGETEVGVTAHMMDAELDAGDVVVQRAVPVGPRETATDLFHRTLELFGPITVAALALIATGRTDWTPQDRSRASFFHKRSDEDGRIDWNRPALEIANLVRAQSDPYPNAYTHHRGERLRILAARPSQRRYGGTPGRIFLREGDGVAIVAGPAARTGREPGLVVERVRTADGRDLPAATYFRSMGGYLTAHP